MGGYYYFAYYPLIHDELGVCVYDSSDVDALLCIRGGNETEYSYVLGICGVGDTSFVKVKQNMWQQQLPLMVTFLEQYNKAI